MPGSVEVAGSGLVPWKVIVLDLLPWRSLAGAYSCVEVAGLGVALFLTPKVVKEYSMNLVYRESIVA